MQLEPLTNFPFEKNFDTNLMKYKLRFDQKFLIKQKLTLSGHGL